MKRKYQVDGMMCAACQLHVNNAVKELEGVENVNVSLLSKNMVVEFDENKVNDELIFNAVDNAGYKASIFVNESIKELQTRRKKELKKKRNDLLISIVLLIVLMVFSMGSMMPPIMSKIESLITININLYYFIMLFNIGIQFVLLVPIIFLNRNRFISGYKSLFSRHPNMDSLVALGSSVSTIYGIYIFVRMIIASISNNPELVMHYSMNIYIESAAMIPIFVSIGKFIEAKSIEKTTSSIATLMSLAPETAYKVDGNEVIEVLTESLSMDDVVLVKPGQSIPTDGYIIEGHSSIDESALTGESTPIYKTVNDKVVGGTINKEGVFKYKVTDIGKDSTMGKMVAFVEEASNSKAHIAQMVDKISMLFIPFVIGASLLVFVIWMILSGFGLVGTYRPDVSLSLQLAISVLVISCPCALGLATPVAIMVGTGIGAEKGILIKNAQAFETLNKVDYVLLDKTGTLTTGKMLVKDLMVYKDDEKELFQKAASLELFSEHPLSKAIVLKAKEWDLELSGFKEFTYIPGKGIKGNNLIVGNISLLEDEGIDISYAMKDYNAFGEKGFTSVFVSENNQLIGIIAIGDTLKENAQIMVKQLQKLHKKVGILTGDNEKSTKYISSLLGVDDVYYDVLPKEKENVVSSLIKEGHIVAMVGDGINDSIALAKAHVGVSIGSGTDAAIDSSDIVVIGSSLINITSAFNLAKRITQTITQNLLWAFFYNIILIPFAAGALYFVKVNPNWFTGFQNHLVLTPMLASLAMSLSSITVVLNALRLRLSKKKY